MSLSGYSLRLFLILLVLGLSTTASVRGEDRIPCFVMGQVVFAPWNVFTSLFMQDPLFQYSLYPLPTNVRSDEKRRLDRVYYPRTRKMLADSFEVIVFYDARVDHFSSRQFEDLADVFREDGMVSFAVHSLSW